MTALQKKDTGTETVQTALMFAQRAALLALLWWLLTEGESNTWYFGIPLVFLATVVSYALAPPSPRSLRGLLRFVPFFIGYSLRGGIDVAWRALHPSLPIFPILVEYRMHLPDQQARLFMANTTSLLPGTLCARLEGELLQLHVLDGRGSYKEELGILERHVAALFRITLRVDKDDNV